MANKSLTHIFMIMREKAIRSKNVYQIEEVSLIEVITTN